MSSLPMPSANELLRRWHSEDAAGHDSMGTYDHSMGNPDAELRLSLWDETMGRSVNLGRRKRAALALRQVRVVRLDDIEEII